MLAASSVPAASASPVCALLQSVGNEAKQKFLSAFNMTPAKTMDEATLRQALPLRLCLPLPLPLSFPTPPTPPPAHSQQERRHSPMRPPTHPAA